MPFVFKRLALLLSIAAAFAADKTEPFKPGPPESFPNHQSGDQMIAAAQAFTSSEKIKAAFGKLDPTRYKVLPVLIVIQNNRARAVNLDRIKVEYVSPNRDRIYATPASEVRYLQPVRRPVIGGGPVGAIMNHKKGPLADPVIDVRAFAAIMLPAGNTASGFFYFDTEFQPG